MPNKETKPKYKVEVEILGQKWTSEGSSIEKALSGLDLTWKDVKGNKSIIRLKYGKMSCEKLLTGLTIKKILINDMTRKIWSRNLELLLQ